MNTTENYILASSSPIWNRQKVNELEKKVRKNFIFLNKKSDLNYESLNKIKPKKLFFPHWSYIIPSSIYENFECVIFHMTDLPYGRGGSPLQNLIQRKVYKTKISAIRCVKELDAGGIYLQKPFSLESGSAETLYEEASNIIENMIVELVEDYHKPVEQKGKVTCFKRRKPSQSNMIGINALGDAYDFIRMLDATGYPHAYIETKNLKFEFTNASLKNNELIATVKILKKESTNE